MLGDSLGCALGDDDTLGIAVTVGACDNEGVPEGPDDTLGGSDGEDDTLGGSEGDVEGDEDTVG